MRRNIESPAHVRQILPHVPSHPPPDRADLSVEDGAKAAFSPQASTFSPWFICAVPESIGIATGFLIAAAHHARLVCLTHTAAKMKKRVGDVMGGVLSCFRPPLAQQR